MEKTYLHGVTYNFDGTASISEVANALLASERMLKEAVGIIDASHPGIKVENLDITFREISQKSPLKELIAVTLVIAFQDDLEEEVPAFIEQMTGIGIPEQYDTMVTVVFVSIALWGSLSLIERLFKNRKNGVSKPNLEREYQNVTNVAGDLLQVDPDTYRALLDDKLGGKKKRSIRKLSRDFFRPAKANGAESIETTSSIKIESDVLNEIPSVIDEEIFEPKTDIHVLERTQIQIRAADLDSEKKGWAGTIDEISEDRVKVHLEPTLSADALFGKTQVTAQVRVYTEENDEGDMKPYLYVIQEVQD